MNLKILIFLHFAIYPTNGELNFHIGVPEFICDKSGDQDVIKSDTTTIGLEGEGTLDFKVGFKKISRTCRNTHRCNLMAWKAVREFENFLNNYPYMKSSSIEFNNTMLIPGLKYILNIFVSQGTLKEQKQFVLNFFDEDSIRTAVKPLAYIKLVGVPSSQADMTYVLHADINICSNISDYYFHWELLDESNNILERLVDRSPELTIPPFTFRGTQKYTIKCQLVTIDKNEPFANSSHSLHIMQGDEPLIVKLPMLYTTVQVQQLINIRPYIVYFGNPDEEIQIQKGYLQCDRKSQKQHYRLFCLFPHYRSIKIKWSCIYNDKNMCENNDGNELNIEGGFLDPGEYNISLEVTKGSVVKSDYCLVRVTDDVPSIEIETLESPILPSSGVTIKANVNELRTFCTLQWQLMEELSTFNLSGIPGYVDELHTITVKRDLFLKELEEFSNDVVNKEFSLVIPPPSDKWAGLPNSGENYNLRFLLEVKCPKAQLQSNDIVIEYSEDMLKDTITVSALVEVEVNAAPKLQPLQVEPLTGVALQTVFTFQTQEAVKIGVDYPLLYKFGYFLGDREFVFCNMLGFKKADSVLPYIDDGVRTFLEVCDRFKSCEKTFGPTINTSAPDKINEKGIVRIFKDKLNAEDFYKAFGYALSVLYTVRSLNEDDKFRQYFSDEVNNKIQYLLNSYAGNEDWSKRVNKLINNISRFNDELLFSDIVLNGLVELRSKLLAAQRANFAARQLLEENKKVTNLENFKSYLEVSDLIITSSPDKNKIEFEKEHLTQKINEYLGRLCVELYERQQKLSLELKTMIFVMEILPKKDFNNFHIIPFDGNLWNITAEIKVDIETLDKITEDKLCIAKTMFKDFFNKTGVTYGAILVSGSDAMDNVESILLMPVDKEQSINKTPKCVIYDNGWVPGCKFIKLFSKYAQCSCTRLGHFYLEYEDNLIFIPTTKDSFDGDSKLTEPSITHQIVDVTNMITEPSVKTTFTKVEETTKSSSESSLTTLLINVTTGVDENSIIVTTNTAKEKSDEVTQSTNLLNHSSIMDTSTDTNVKIPSDPPPESASTERPESSTVSKNQVTTGNSNIITQSAITEIVEVTDILEAPAAAVTSVTPKNSGTEESVRLTSSKDPNPTPLVTKVPDPDSDISTTIRNSDAYTKTTLATSADKATIPVMSPLPFTSYENTTKSVDSEERVNTITSINTVASLLPLSPTTENVINEVPKNENVPIDEGDKNVDGDSKIATEAIQTVTQFLPPLTTVSTQNVTNPRKLQNDRFKGIQGGIQANFNTGFAFNFYLNTTYK